MLITDTLLHTHYRIERRVGQGAMGAVYQARDLRNDELVAIKHVPAGDARLRSALDREARLLTRLRHPILPRVREYFADADGWCLVMDFIPGDDLGTILERATAPLPLVDVLRWADQLLDGLDYLHTRQPAVIHRDIKPRNLKLTPSGDVVLLDFGLSKGAADSVANDASLFGYTLAYAPLEQIRGERTSPRSDLYALAATLYDLLNGVPPPSAIQRAAALLDGLPDPLRFAYELNPQVSQDMAAVLHSALAINLVHRPASASVMRLALHAASDSRNTAAQLPTSSASAREYQRAAPHNLPVQPTPLVGRAEQVAALGDLLRRADVRLIALTGTAGIGKTRLGLQAAEHALSDFADGAFFVPLAAIRDPSLVAVTIAATLNLKERAGQPLAETLKAYLREKELLLVLDNFEQVLDAALLVSELLAAAPRLKVLVTTREVLRLRGEYDFAVPPLALPPPEPRTENHELRTENREPYDRESVLGSRFSVLSPLAELMRYGAVDLFVSCAQAARRDFALSATNASAVAAICIRLDGLPLAIELAAARIKTLDPHELLAWLERRLELLIDGPRDLPARQQTLRAAIAWSYDLLDADERRLFAQLGVFVGGWTLEATAAVAAESRVEHEELKNTLHDPTLSSSQTFNGQPILNLLSALVEKNLIQRRAGAEQAPRFNMLESIREYAQEQLAAGNQHAALRQRHAGYFLRLAEQAEPELRGANQTAWLARLEADHDNLRAAQMWAVEYSVSELALRLSAALGFFWETRGYLSEGHTRLSAALELGSDLPSSLQARALTQLGNLCYVQSDLQHSRACHARSLAIYRELGDQHGTAWALYYLGRAQREYAPGHSYLSESLAIFRALGDRAGIAAGLNDLGGFERWRGAYTAAIAYHQESLALYRELGDRVGCGLALYYLASVAMTQSELDAAKAYYRESMEHFHAVGARIDWAWALHNLGTVAAHQGDLAVARPAFAESTAIFQALGDQSGVAWSFYNRGCMALNSGDSAAQTLLLEGLALFQSVDDPWGMSWSLTRLGHAASAHGRLAQAQDWLREALALHQRVVSNHGIAGSLEGFARLAVARDQPARAVRLYAAAEALRQRIGAARFPAERPAYDRTLAATRAQLGDAAFAAAWAAGQAMNAEQAAAYALEEIDER